MPLKISDEQTSNETILNIIEFVEEGEAKYFNVKNDNGASISVNYIPISKGEWDKERFRIYLFENAYLNAENDVFQIKESTLDERLGWIFPITVLESNNNDFADKKNLNKYKFIAYQKLLEKTVTLKPKTSSSEYTLNEMFPDSIICILSEDTISKIPNFKIKDYFFSFYEHGYIVYKPQLSAKGIYNRSNFLQEMRNGRTSITIKKSNFDIDSNEYIKSLFVKNHLLQSESYVVRFIFLYQIIEIFISEEFDKQFAVYLDEYQQTLIGKNDLKESISNISKERALIKDIINRIPIENQLKVEFSTECDFLFDDLKFKPKQTNFPDKVYDLRNIMVHRLRELTHKTEEMNRILEIFERVIINILISYTDKDNVEVKLAE